MRVNKIFIDFSGVHHELGGYDIDCVSLVACINYMMRDLHKRSKYDDENFECKGRLPWSGETLRLQTDKQFMDYLELHLAKGMTDVHLQIDLLPLQTLSLNLYFVPTNSA